jgi:hypothetical protein
MDSRVPVRHLSKTVCLVALLLSAPAGAQIDSPGFVSFHFLAEPDAIYQTFEQVPKDAPLSYTRNKAYLSSDASEFEDAGVRIWTGFDLEGPEGPRHGMLILDLNLYHPEAVRAEYMETRNDQILFEGVMVAGEARILDLWLDGGDSGSVEGEFECIFMDPAERAEGSRVLLAGHFFTETRPQRQIPDPDIYYEDDTYVETGCGSDVYVEDDFDDSGCGGSDYDDDYDYDYGGSSDCEGDSYDSGSDSGCEGDSYDSGYSDSSSCEGDSYDSYDSSDSSGGLDCEGDEAYAATLKPAPRKHRRPNPLRAVMRMFPEIVGISFIVFLKRRFRAGRL